MPQMNDPHATAPDPLGVVALATPAILLLRAEMWALGQMLPGHVPSAQPGEVGAQEAVFEASMDNLPI